MTTSLKPLLNPQSVAIIGASSAPERIGGRPLHYMLKHGFKGAIYPVNPRRDRVQGLPAYPTIADVPEKVDCAIIAVPAKDVVDTMRACVSAGVKSAVLFSSGFAEAGHDGATAQAEVATIAREGRLRLLGPNCLGVINGDHNWFGTFANGPAESRPATGGSVGIVSQSGAYGSHIYISAQARRIGVRYWVTTGNEADIDVAEMIDFYAHDPEVRVIMAYVEGVKDGPRMRRALADARSARKPVIIMKVGGSAIGAKAAATHTASVVGRDSIYDAVFRQYGAYRAQTTQEMVDVAYACQFGRYPKGRRTCLQSISGGAGVQMADVAEDTGLRVPPLPDSLQAKIKALIPQASPLNPVDFTANAVNDPEIMPRNLDYTLSSDLFDGHVVYLTSVPGSPFTRVSCLDAFRRIREAHPDAVIVMSMLVADEVIADYEALGLPCFSDPAVAVRVMATLADFQEHFERPAANADLAAAGEEMPDAPKDIISEYGAKRILAACGLTISQELVVSDGSAARDAAGRFPRPVALKIASPDIPHKTEMGGVLLNVEGVDAISDGVDTLLARARTAVPDARIEGVLISEMAPAGVEVIVGMTHDKLFGPVVMVGLGGVFVEVLKDVSFRLAPVGLAEAHRMISELRGAPILDGARGAAPVNQAALALAISRLSVFADKNAGLIESIDINPLIVSPTDAIAVDGLIVPSTSPAIASVAHKEDEQD